VRALVGGSNPYGRASLGRRPPFGGLDPYSPLPGERVQGEGSFWGFPVEYVRD